MAIQAGVLIERVVSIFMVMGPLSRGDTARFVFGDIDDLHGPARGFGLFDGTFVALAAHLVGVPAIVAGELEALVRDVLGDGGDEVARTEDLEVALNLRVEAGAVDDGALGIGPVRTNFCVFTHAVSHAP